MNVIFENEPGKKLMHAIRLSRLGIKSLPSASVNQPRRAKKPAVNPAAVAPESNDEGTVK